MNSLRLLGRALPKASSLRPVSSRCYSIAARAPARPSWHAIKKLSYPSFSTSIARKEGEGDGDVLLASKLAEERALELGETDPDADTAEIAEFRAKGVWDINEKPGTHEIVLERKWGNETIKVEVNIMSMTEFDPDEDFDPAEEDGALADEDFEQPKRTINQSGTKGGPIDIAPEDSIAPSDREGGEESNRTPFPINLEITISKPGDQSIEITGSARDGTIEIDRIQYNPTSSIAADVTTTAYAGPPFNNLDADLIMMFEQYIEERGINEELATILPVLIEQKEQKEYVNWLQNVQKFIEA